MFGECGVGGEGDAETSDFDYRHALHAPGLHNIYI